uniref:Uncharacterized protein n=1 Tax=Panagrolaimus davidi TaxID=227884 RepID=A0A914P0Z1_9BILA
MWQLCEESESVLQIALYAQPLINHLKELIDDQMLLFTYNSPFDAFPGAAKEKENSKAMTFFESLKQRPIPASGSEVVPIIAKNI